MGHTRTGGRIHDNHRDVCKICGYYIYNRQLKSTMHKDCARGKQKAETDYYVTIRNLKIKMVEKRKFEGAKKPK